MVEQWAVERKRQRAFADFDVRHLRGVEIGPLDRPLVRPGSSEIYYVDHLPTDELREKYATHETVDVAAIPPVDFVWTDTPLRALIGAKAPLDYIVAAHVIEHVPDLIGWLLEMMGALAEGGRLVLVIPDKRYTFDVQRRTSSIHEVMAAYEEGRRRPGLRQILDHFANVVSADCSQLWADRSAAERLPFCHGPEYLELAAREYAEGKYIDVHCWVFTPQSFFELLALASEQLNLGFDLEYFLPTQAQDLEFYVQLKKSAAPATLWAEAARQAGQNSNKIVHDPAFA